MLPRLEATALLLEKAFFGNALNLSGRRLRERREGDCE
jgi:hypothetical protein